MSFSLTLKTDSTSEGHQKHRPGWEPAPVGGSAVTEVAGKREGSNMSQLSGSKISFMSEFEDIISYLHSVFVMMYKLFSYTTIFTAI